MVSDAGSWNVRPAGSKWTRLTVSDGATAVMVTGASSAPAGTDSVCGPTCRVPPSGPIVWVTESAGSGEHGTTPVNDPSRSPRLAWGTGARERTPSGEGSAQLRAART